MIDTYIEWQQIIDHVTSSLCGQSFFLGDSIQKVAGKSYAQY